MRTPLVFSSPIVVDHRGRQVGRRRSIWSLFPIRLQPDAQEAMRQALAGQPFRVGHAKQKARRWQIVCWLFRPIFARGRVAAVEVTTARATRSASS